MFVDVQQLDLERAGKDRYRLRFRCMNEEHCIVRIMREVRNEGNCTAAPSTGANYDSPNKRVKISNSHGKSLENSPIPPANAMKLMQQSRAIQSQVTYNSDLNSTISPFKRAKDILPSDLLSQHVAIDHCADSIQGPESRQFVDGNSRLCHKEISKALVSDSLQRFTKNDENLENDSSLHESFSQYIDVFSSCVDLAGSEKHFGSDSMGGKVENLPNASTSQQEEHFLSMQSQELLPNHTSIIATDEKAIPGLVEHSFPDLSQTTLMELECAMISFEKKSSSSIAASHTSRTSQDNPFVIGNVKSELFACSAKSPKFDFGQDSLHLPHSNKNSSALNSSPSKLSFTAAPTLGGFKTAAGKDVAINPDSLAKAKSFFNDAKTIEIKQMEENSTLHPKNEFKAHSIEENSNKCLDNSHEQLESRFDDEIIQNIQQDFGGFATAAGKKISICKDSIQKASKMLDDKPAFDVHKDDTRNPHFPVEGGFDVSAGFSTAAGAKIKISDANLQKAKSILRDSAYKTENNAVNIHEDTLQNQKDFEDKRANNLDSLQDKENVNPNVLPKQLSIDNAMNSTVAKPGRVGLFLDTKKKTTTVKTSVVSGIRNPQFIPPKLRPIEISKVKIKTERVNPVVAFDLQQLKTALPSLKQYVERMNCLRMNSAKGLPRLYANLCDGSRQPNSMANNHNVVSQAISVRNVTIASFEMQNMYNTLLQFIPGCPLEWFKNHSLLLYWKYNSLQLKYPVLFNFTLNDITEEMRYRYQLEFLEGKRSIVKLIAERDESPSLNMVLVVYDIIYDDPLTLVLTDGWYFIRAKVDEPLSWLIVQKKIFVGLKLCIYGAHLDSSSSDGVEVLESFDKISLKIFANSTKPAPPFAKLGLCKHFCFAVSLNRIFPDGGIIPCLDVVVQRKYSLSYMKSGVSITSDEYFKIIQKIQQAFYTEQQSNNEQDSLTNYGHSNYHKAANENYDKYQQELKTITCYFKFKISNYAGKPSDTEAIFTFWRPNEDILDLIREGCRIRIFNARATSNYQGVLSICNTNATGIEVKKADEDVLTKCFSKRQVVDDFRQIKQGQECDMHVFVETIVFDFTNGSKASGQKIQIRDSLANNGVLNLTNRLIVFQENQWHFVKNAYLNFYDANTNSFIFTLSDQSTAERIRTTGV